MLPRLPNSPGGDHDDPRASLKSYDFGYLVGKVETMERDISEIKYDVKSLLGAKHKLYGAAGIIAAAVSFLVGLLR